MAVSKKNSDLEGFIRLGDGIWFVKSDRVQAIDKSHPTYVLSYQFEPVLTVMFQLDIAIRME